MHTAPALTVVTFVILACYRGGFGTMPAFVPDYFRPKNVDPFTDRCQPGGAVQVHLGLC